MTSPAPSGARWSVWLTGSIILYGLTFTVLLLGSPFHDRGMTFVSDLGGLAAPFLAVVLLALASRSSRDMRRPWLLCSVGILAWAVGDSIWTFYELALHEEAPFPSVADAFYLSGYILLFFGALAFSHRNGSSLQLRTALDAVAVTLAGTALIWRIAVEPIFLDSSANELEKVLSALYPIGDALVLFALSLAMFRHRDGRAGRVFGTLSLGLLLVLVSDVLFAYLQNKDAYTSGSIVDAGWTVGYLTMAVAGLMQMQWQPSYESTGDDLADPAWKQGLPLAVMTAIASWVILDGFDGQAAAIPMLGAVLLMMCAVVLRHLFTLHENIELRRHLERTYAQERERARIDPVTQTLNRRAILEVAEQRLSTSEQLTLVLADMDGMKAINDGRGHQAGDEALAVAAKALSAEGAIVGRYGGDEFLVLLSGGPDLVDSYRNSVGATLDELQSAGIHISISLGFASSTGHETQLTALISHADREMYAAKRSRGTEPRKSLVVA